MPSVKLPNLDIVRPIVEKYGKDPNALLQILIEVQEILHCVPKDAQELISKELFGKSRVRVPAVISFYSFLSPTYLGDYVIYVADNIIEQMAGNRELADYLCSKLGVKMGKVRGDGRVSVHFTSCIGMSDQAPAILVNGRTIPRLTREKVDVIAQSITAAMPVERWPESLFVIEENIRRSDVLFRRRIEPGSAIRTCLDRAKAAEAPVPLDESLSPHPSESARTALDHAAQETLAEMYRSDLRGRGGAGFKAAIKWETARDKRGTARYVLCNADEGEPGTFKDRSLLQGYADMVFEGMTVCGFTVGAKLGILYIRGEYRYMREHLEEVLKARREQHLLGENILGSPFSFDIKIHWGAGAYVCGMETAMIESIEGKRGTPRKRWPLPVEWGYKGQPTVVNNVETFAAAAIVAVKGGNWFAQHGTMQSTGTKLFCVSGDCDRPGIYEYPFGVSIREVLRDCGARNTQAVQVSGPSGTTLSEKEFDRLLAFEDVPSVGTLMIFDKSRDMFEVLYNFAQFFQHESCGLCTPCRVGTTLLVNILEKIQNGMGSYLDLDEIRNISNMLKTFSHCGLGQTAQAPFLDALAKFPHIFDKRMKSKEFIPAFNLNAALDEARQLTGRSDSAAFMHEDLV